MAAATLTPDYASLMTEQTSVEGDRLPNKSPEVKATETDSNKDGKIRHPFWLTKPAPILFATVFAACGVALIVLDRSSRNGLPLSISASEYSWTYGPTAILVVILSFWRRIDYYYKSTQPWRELHAGPAPADRSLLLDYISPFELTSMSKAFKAKHYPVVATILSFFSHQKHHLGVDHLLSRAISRDGSDKFVWEYLARLNGGAKNDTEWNTQDGMVTQRLRQPDSALNMTTLEAPVDIFMPIVECEEAKLSPTSGVDERFDQWLNYRFDSPTCPAANAASVDLCDKSPEDHPRDLTACGIHPRVYSYHRVDCSASKTTSEEDLSATDSPDNIEDDDIRYAITAAQFEGQLNGTDGYKIGSFKVLNTSSIICKIGYTIISANATWDLLTGRVTFAEGALEEQGRLLPNLSSPALAEMLWTGLQSAAAALKVDKDKPGGRDNYDLVRVDETFFQLLVAKLGDQDDMDILFKTSVLKDTSISVLEGLATELAPNLLSEKKDVRGTASGVVSEPRLHIRPISLWTMVAGFFVLALLSCFLLFATSTDFWVPSMCGSIAGHATILANSQALQTFLRGTGHYSNKELRSKLQGMQFTGTTDATSAGGFAVEITDQNPTPGEFPIAEASAKRKSWVPMTGRFSYVVTMHIATLLAIVGLEVLQRLSDQKNGLLDIRNNDSTVPSYTIRLASTAAVFAIATMFNCLDFTIVTFAPYSSLRSGRVQAEKSILFNLLSVSPFLVLFKSLRRKQFGAAASNVSSLIGGFLTIIVSGLWVLNAPLAVERSSTTNVGNWDASWPNDAPDDDGGAAIKLNIIRYGGSDTPAAIWNDSVLPKIDTSSPTLDAVDRSANYTYNLGALRPTLNCTTVAKEDFRSSLSFFAISQPGYVYSNNVGAQITLPSECVDESSSGMANLSFSTETKAIVWGGPEERRTGWVARYLDLNTTVGKACPSVGVLFGLVDYTSNDTSTWNLTALVCSQGIEQLPVEVSYTGDPSLEQLDEEKPPRFDPTKVSTWHDASNGQAFGYRLGRHLDADLSPFPTDQEETDPLITPDAEVDAFFNHLLLGPNKLSRHDLVGTKNVDNLIRAVTRDYSEYMSIVIDVNFRAKSNSTRSALISGAGEASTKQPSSATTEITGTSSQEVTRLAIHSTSKVILQVLLGTMVIGGLTSYALVKLDGTLPRNPCTIASTMGFLAGSQLCDPGSDIIPQGAEFMSDQQLKQAFNGWVFSLGWWYSQDASVEGSDETVNHSGLLDGYESSSRTISRREKTNGRFGVDVGRANVSKFDKDS
ncbi:hypothetical protein NM208_g12436 [Fusarium decemcellulare]|uniref:Uncharacterized protein n=1 Tax=Fusarium decemcellulare TaxID=57161 RepID=A0ACC1RNL8_9HYPO|nr:hypothetical protein NM208_g12436 [Fusarium decemcellulare]